MADEENLEAEGMATEDTSKPKACLTESTGLILLLVNLIALGGLGYLQLKLFKQLEKQETVEDLINADKDTEKNPLEVALKKDDGVLVPLQTFTANLAQGDGLDDLFEWMRF